MTFAFADHVTSFDIEHSYTLIITASHHNLEVQRKCHTINLKKKNTFL